ncbi:MAG: hypothetical protein O7D95_06260 [Betaproteobacteria bacterium]|nr:hypothetical protein [Betaproteobacteria bacterium]
MIEQPQDGRIIVEEGIATRAFFLLLSDMVGLINDDITLTTTEDLEDITSDINTSPDKVLGFPGRNLTTRVLVFASGSGDGDVWHRYDSSTAHTPV